MCATTQEGNSLILNLTTLCFTKYMTNIESVITYHNYKNVMIQYYKW